MAQAPPALGQEVPASLQPPPPAMGREVGAPPKGITAPGSTFSDMVGNAAAMLKDTVVARAKAAESSQKNPETEPTIGTYRSDPVTVGDLRADFLGSMQRIGVLLKKDLSDPKLWLSAAAMYFAPKVFSTAAPIVARAASSAKNLATMEMAKDVAKVGLGGSRVEAGLRIADRVGQAVTTARGSASPPATAAAPPAASTPAVASPAHAPRPVASAGPVKPAAPAVKPHLTWDEFQAAQQLIKQGYSKEDVLKAIVKNKLPASWLKLPSDAEIAASIKDRNATGRWPEDQD